MTGDALRYRLAHLLVTRQLDHDAYRRLVDLLDAGRPPHEVERALADEVRSDAEGVVGDLEQQ